MLDCLSPDDQPDNFKHHVQVQMGPRVCGLLTLMTTVTSSSEMSVQTLSKEVQVELAIVFNPPSMSVAYWHDGMAFPRAVVHRNGSVDAQQLHFGCGTMWSVQ